MLRKLFATGCMIFAAFSADAASIQTPATSETITLGGGCFWCLEAVFDELKGVSRVESGYAGGHVANPNYEQVSAGDTGHAEVVQITFDPRVINRDIVLQVYFTIHDPTTLNRQGSDVVTIEDNSNDGISTTIGGAVSFDLGTGRELWTVAYEAPGSLPYNGSRNVPTVDNNYIFTVGPFGHLHCVDRISHRILWARHLVDDFRIERLACTDQLAQLQAPAVRGHVFLDQHAPHGGWGAQCRDATTLQHAEHRRRVEARVVVDEDAGAGVPGGEEAAPCMLCPSG